MIKWAAGCFLMFFLLFPLHAGADSFYSSGRVHNTSGARSRILFYRHFNVTKDGYVTGYIVNESNRTLKSVVIDMYTMDEDETRVFWQTILNIGNMAPRSKYAVREPYSPLPDDPAKVVFRFKLHGSDEYRIPKLKN